MNSASTIDEVLGAIRSPFPKELRRQTSLSLGLITDTHGLLRKEAVEALQGVDAILHTGDIGGPEILVELSRIAPVRAVRGNNDSGDWATNLPDTARFELAGLRLFAIHDRKELELGLEALDADVLICGHSHRPSIEVEDRVLCINSGSAGPRRFTLPVGLAYLKLEDSNAEAELVTFDL